MRVSVKSEGKLDAFLNDLAQRGQRRSLTVGVLNQSGRSEDANGPTFAQIAKWLEYGWIQQVTPKQRAYFHLAYGRHTTGPNKGKWKVNLGARLRMPPRPFLRGTYSAKIGEWSKLAVSVFRATHDTEKALSAVGEIAVVDIKTAMASGGIPGGERFAERSPLTLYLYALDAKAGRHRVKGRNNTTTSRPLVKTGKLLNSIAYEIKGE